MDLGIELYMKYNLIVPSITAIIFMSFVVVNAVGLYRTCKSKGDISKKIIHIIAIVLFLKVVYDSSYPIGRGLYLVHERDHEAVTVTCEVLDITTPQHAPKYYYKHKPTFAVWIHTTDQKYYMVDTGEISIGDHIEITYLPNSRYVIDYKKVMQEEDS